MTTSVVVNTLIDLQNGSLGAKIEVLADCSLLEALGENLLPCFF
jgi:hypothetical protein